MAVVGCHQLVVNQALTFDTRRLLAGIPWWTLTLHELTDSHAHWVYSIAVQLVGTRGTHFTCEPRQRVT